MSYATCRAGLHATLSAIEGINSNLQYLPTSVSVPALYSVLARTEYPITAGLKVVEYYFDVWLLVRWQANEAAENELDDLLALVPAAIAEDKYLGNGCKGGAWVTDSEMGFATISSTRYRAVRYTVRVKDVNG